MQKPGTSGVQRGKPTEGEGLPTGPSKRQGSAGGTPEGDRLSPKQGVQLSYARVARDGLLVAVVSETNQRARFPRRILQISSA